MNATLRQTRLPRHLPPAYSLALAAAAILIDYALGPRIEFPALFLIPVAYGAWYGGRRWALPLSLLPAAHIWTVLAWGAPPWGIRNTVIAAAVRILMLAGIGWWVAKVGQAHRALATEVALLEGLLPICSYCKNIRDHAGRWQVLEEYIQERSAATFTHGICDSCLHAQFAEIATPESRSG